MSLDERAKYMARQGQAFATAEEARVVYTDSGDELRDVPADGKTVGEIVVRGNIVMKEVGQTSLVVHVQKMTWTIVFQRSRGDQKGIQGRSLLVW